jgi:hypothetical protein
MNDGFEPLQVLWLSFPDVDLQLRDLLKTRSERTPTKNVAVKPRDVVACVTQHRHHHRADVALVSGNEDAHEISVN